MTMVETSLDPMVVPNLKGEVIESHLNSEDFEVDALGDGWDEDNDDRRQHIPGL